MKQGGAETPTTPIGQQQAAMGAAAFEQPGERPTGPLVKQPVPPGVFMALPDLGQTEEAMGGSGRFRQQAKKKTG